MLYTSRIPLPCSDPGHNSGPGSVPDKVHPPHRPLRRRGRLGLHGQDAGAEDHVQLGPAGYRGQPRGRRRDHRRAAGGEFGTGRLHHIVCLIEHLRYRAGAEPKAAVQPGEGLRADLAGGAGA